MAEGLVLNENRSLVRRELIYYLKVTDRDTGQELGRLGDIHTEGMQVLTPQPLPFQAVYKLYLELPKAMAAQEEFSAVPVRGQVVWGKAGPPMSNYYVNGLRFLELPPQGREVISRLTETFAMPS